MLITITNRHLTTKPLTEQLELVIQQKQPDLIILREKDLSENDYAQLAKQVLSLCQNHQIPLMLHTFTAVAEQLNHRYIHLPFQLFLEQHQQFNDTWTIGTSIHSVKEALLAQKYGASYIIAGHIFATDCKKNLDPRGLEFLTKVCQAVSIPVYGIGGITDDNQSLIYPCGAKGVCMMSSLMAL